MLPSHSPRQEVWIAIEKKLDMINLNNNALNVKLPSYKAPSDLWNTIEIKLKKQNLRRIQFRLLKIAAGFAILISLGIVIINLKGSKEYSKISYSEVYESETEHYDILELANPDIDMEKILASNCKTMPQTCSDKKYIELNHLKKMLNIEEKKLRVQLQKYKDPEIKNYLMQIQSEKQKIERYMLNMFINNTI